MSSALSIAGGKKHPISKHKGMPRGILTNRLAKFPPVNIQLPHSFPIIFLHNYILFHQACHKVLRSISLGLYFLMKSLVSPKTCIK